MIAAYGRYRQIKYYLGHIGKGAKSVNDDEKVPGEEMITSLAKYNYISWIFFLIAMLGFVMVGNFRSGELIHNHMMGANMGFFNLLVYGLLMVSCYISD